MLRQSFSGRRGSKQRKKERCLIEALEQRTLLSVTINAGTDLRAVPSNFIGVNTAPWDGLLSSAQTLTLSEAAGISSVRIGGGSYIDGTTGDPNGWHFDVNNQTNSLPAQLAYITGLGATAIIDVNYGTSSPQEAAAEMAYLNAPINNPAIDNVVIGTAMKFTGTATGNGALTGGWVAGGGVSVSGGAASWQTVGFWASLRAATPLAVDDGLNFLRLGRAAPFAFHYYEIGNEDYGSWEADAQGITPNDLSNVMPSGKTPTAHDPTTIIAFSKQFQLLTNQIDPTISIGIDSQDTGTGAGDLNDWIGNILTQSVAQGFTLGYIADHYYTSANPSSVSDATLLGTPTTPAGNNSYDLTQRINAYDTLIDTLYVAPLGAGANHPQLLVDEFNSVSSNPGKQSVSLVNGLFVADALGAALDTTGTDGLAGAAGVWIWDLHNGAPGGSTPDEAASLYGWRTGTGFGDYGILGAGNSGGSTGSGANVEYPDYFALQLASKLIQTGGTVVGSTDDGLVDTYSVLEPNGDLDVLVVNKTNPRLNGDTTAPPNNLPDPTVTEQFNIAGYAATGAASIWQYGVAQDDAADNSAKGFAASLANSNANFSISNGSFSMAIPDYTMMLIDLKPAITPVIQNPAAAAPSPVSGASTQLSVSATSPDGTALTYTWSATGPASVLFIGNANGTAAATSITADFTQAGQYNFTVKVANTSGLFVTSSVTVNVSQTVTAIAVTPPSMTIATGATEQFSATATDQFGNAIGSPAFDWSISGSGNSMDSTGLASLGQAAGNFTVTAAIGGVQGLANVTTLAAPVVSGYTVNDGTAQRAMVTSLTVTFSEPVTLGTGAITLSQRDPNGGASTPEVFTLSNPSSDQMTYVLTFSAAGDLAGSLPDGVYDLVVHAALVVNPVGSTLAGGDQTFSFYRLYADYFGVGSVGFSDLVLLAQDFDATSGQGNFLPFMDIDGDGTIGFAELVKLAQNFGDAESATSTALSLSSNSVVLGQAVTLTATVTPIGAAVPVTSGTVTFLDGTTTIGSVPVNTSGSATLSTYSLFTGTHALSAVYSGSDPTSTGTASLTIALPAFTNESGGLQVATVAAGSGAAAQSGHFVSVDYTGYLTDGTEFDSSLNPGRTPFNFDLGEGQTIAGFDQGVTGMLAGETRVLEIPPALAYGAAGIPPTIPPNATLIFIIRMLNVNLPRLGVLGGAGETVPVANNQAPSVATGTDFGTVSVGSSSAASAFQLFVADSNDTSLELTGNPLVQISGADSADFILTQPSSANGFVFTIAFNPQATGTLTATITILSNDTDVPNYTFTLTGVGA